MAGEEELKIDPDTGIQIPESQAEHDAWEPNEAEQLAMAGGWKPENEWEGDPDDWVKAREFNFRGELMNRISQQGRKLGTLEGALDKAHQMIAASDRVTQKLVAEAIAKTTRDLKMERRAAMREDDFETVDRIDEELQELTEAARESKAPANQASAAPGASDRPPTPIEAAWFTFVTSTPWAQEPGLNAALLKHAQDELTKSPDMNVGDFMESVLDKGKELRGLSRRPAPPGGPDGGNGGNRPRTQRGGKDKFTSSDLNEQQRAIGQEYIEAGILKSLDEYAAQIGEVRGLDRQQR